MKNILMLFLILIACNNHNTSGNSINEDVLNSNYMQEDKVENAIGFVTVSDNYQFGDNIIVLDKKYLPVDTIIIIDEYQISQWRCLAIQGDYYKIILPDNIIGYIKKSPKIKFQTWEEHILSLFSVGFDPETNPIRLLPKESSKIIDYDSQTFYHPVQIKGNWLQIKWETDENWHFGWIKWRDKEKLLLEFYYFA